MFARKSPGRHTRDSANACHHLAAECPWLIPVVFRWRLRCMALLGSIVLFVKSGIRTLHSTYKSFKPWLITFILISPVLKVSCRIV